MKFIDGVEVANPFFLAPMAGVTDNAFRTICAEKGAALTYTEMVSAKALCYSDRKTAELLSIADEHRPCFAQIFGSEPEVCAKGAVLALKISGADGIDINMGCPMPKIVKNGEGSALMRDTDKIYHLVKAVSAAVEVPVTVKIRAGYDAEHINAVEVACAAEAAGASAIGVHGRTREQLYTGTSSRVVIASVKRAVSVPVIASGDAFSAKDCIETLKDTKADFVMIARGAQGNPDIFARACALYNGQPVPEPDCKSLMNALLRQAEIACTLKGERKAVAELRKHALWYLGHLIGAKPLKTKAACINSYKDLEAVCNEAIALGLKAR